MVGGVSSQVRSFAASEKLKEDIFLMEICWPFNDRKGNIKSSKVSNNVIINNNNNSLTDSRNNTNTAP